jgi:histone H2A
MATPSRKSATKKSAKKASGNKSAKAGLTFPVGRVSSMIRKGRFAKRVSASAGVYATAVLDYLTSELLEVAVKYVTASKKNSSRITPRALTLAVRHDKDLGALLKNVTLSKGGVVPTAVAGKKAAKKSSKKSKKNKA